MEITAEEFCSKFKGICRKKEDASTLLKTMHKVTSNEGEIIIEPGQTSNTLYLVWSGSLSVSIHQQNVTVELGHILPGGWFGELGFIEPGPASATVTTNEEATLFSLDQDGLQTLLEENPDIVTEILHTLSLHLAERLRATKQHVFKQIAEDNFLLTKDAQSNKADKWYKHFGRKLMGISGERQ